MCPPSPTASSNRCRDAPSWSVNCPPHPQGGRPLLLCGSVPAPSGLGPSALSVAQHPPGSPPRWPRWRRGDHRLDLSRSSPSLRRLTLGGPPPPDVEGAGRHTAAGVGRSRRARPPGSRGLERRAGLQSAAGVGSGWAHEPRRNLGEPRHPLVAHHQQIEAPGVASADSCRSWIGSTTFVLIRPPHRACRAAVPAPRPAAPLACGPRVKISPSRARTGATASRASGSPRRPWCRALVHLSVPPDAS